MPKIFFFFFLQYCTYPKTIIKNYRQNKKQKDLLNPNVTTIKSNQAVNFTYKQLHTVCIHKLMFLSIVISAIVEQTPTVEKQTSPRLWPSLDCAP